MIEINALTMIGVVVALTMQYSFVAIKSLRQKWKAKKSKLIFKDEDDGI